jgi:hypothetical protein
MAEGDVDGLMAALARYQAEGATPETRQALWRELSALIDARVMAALREAGVTARVSAEDEERRVEHGNDD